MKTFSEALYIDSEFTHNGHKVDIAPVQKFFGYAYATYVDGKRIGVFERLEQAREKAVDNIDDEYSDD
jgi:hypothetical protein